VGGLKKKQATRGKGEKIRRSILQGDGKGGRKEHRQSENPARIFRYQENKGGIRNDQTIIEQGKGSLKLKALYIEEKKEGLVMKKEPPKRKGTVTW